MSDASPESDARGEPEPDAPDVTSPAPASPRLEPTPLPLHRLASSALVAAAVAGPIGAAAFVCSASTMMSGPRVDSTLALLSAVVIGACSAFFVGCTGLLLRAPAGLRVVLLALAGTTIFVFGAAVGGWAQGLARGGPELAWREMVREMRWVFDRSGSLALLFSPTAPFLLMGAPRAGLAPRLGWPTRARWQALAGGLSGVAFTAVLWMGPTARKDGALMAVFALTGVAVGAALGLADQLEPRLAAALRRRVVGD